MVENLRLDHLILEQVSVLIRGLFFLVPKSLGNDSLPVLLFLIVPVKQKQLVVFLLIQLTK